jgi:diguanylate cyclase (GGDEF)-like protein
MAGKILDLSTLYIVILMISLCTVLIWGALWRYYPSIGGSQYWMLANLLSAGGGLAMALGEPMQSLLPVMLGNAAVISGFWLVWCGIRRFQGRRSYWELSLAAGVLVFLLLLLVQDSRIGRNAVYTIGQSIPMVAAALALMGYSRLSPAILATVAASFVGAVGNSMRLSGLVAHQEGWLSTEHYNQVLFATMLAVIFSGMVRNLGLMLMVIDRLRKNLQTLPTVDDLTGLPNRRHFMSRILEEQDLALARRLTFSLMVIDIDKFKQINDTYGHAAGDACLMQFADIVRDRLRKTDLVARMGCDEFCILLPGTPEREAVHVAEELLFGVRTHDVRWKEISIPMTLSIGIAEWSYFSPTTVGELFQHADEVLYAVKRRGRDGYQGSAPPDARTTRPHYPRAAAE